MSFAIQSLTDVEETVKFVNKHFVPYQPLCKGIGANAEDIEGFFRPAIEKWLKFGLSLGMRNEQDGELAGILISIISRKGEEIPYEVDGEFNSKTKILMKLLIWLEEQYNFFIDKSTEEAIYHVLMAVDKRHSGKKLSYQLMEESDKRAKQKGFKYTYTQLSANSTQHILPNIGYKIAKDISCNEVTVDGENPLNLDKMLGLKTVRFATRKLQ